LIAASGLPLEFGRRRGQRSGTSGEISSPTPSQLFATSQTSLIKAFSLSGLARAGVKQQMARNLLLGSTSLIVPDGSKNPSTHFTLPDWLGKEKKL